MKPKQIVWALKIPPGRVCTLFTKQVLTEELDIGISAEAYARYVLGELVRGAMVTPASEGCQQATWDPVFTYCHVQVLNGDLAETYGWVNQKFIPRQSFPA